MDIQDLAIQKDDWKKEKHVPVIEIKGPAKKGEPVDILLCVGKEIPHPNTTEHHIRWIKLFFQPDGEKYPVHLGTYAFEAHAESVEGPNKGSAKCEPCAYTRVILEKSGTLIALSYCNIHGLWQNDLRVDLEG
ncbi:MAG: class II SORL domain-containing protein [Bacillota bacterium]|nr:MAG: Neelaredoxin [Bacillota bacterium]